MKYGKKLAAFLLLLALTLQLFGCHTEPKPTEPPTTESVEPTTEAPPTAAELYEEAAAQLTAATEGAYEFLINTTRYTGDAVIETEESRILRYNGLGTENYTAMLDSKTTIGNLTPMLSREVYTDGVMYWFIPNEVKEAEQKTTLFSCEMEAAAYQERLLPLELLDPALYGSAVIESEGHLVFTEPTELESWLLPEDSEYVHLNDAKGELQLDGEGKLKAMTYEVSYYQGFVSVEQKYTLRPAAGKPVPDTKLPLQADPTELENMDLPYLLSYVGYVADSMAGCSMSCSTAELIFSEAGSAMQIKNNDMYSYGSGESYAAKSTSSVNISQGKESASYETEEILKDGKGSYAVNGDVQVYDNANTTAFQSYITWEMTSFLPRPKHIEYAELSEVGGYWRVRFAGNKLYGLLMEDRATGSMYDDREMLDKLAESYATDLLEGYLYIDKDSLLPAAISVEMESRHKIEGYFYALNLNADQTFEYGNRDVYEEITGEMFPEEAPEEKATPVFYEVTSPEGQTMYLLGTIHIGDERTAYLPQEIYDAFDASDALAVEFDLLSFVDAVEEDEEMAETLAASYYYTDGTTAEDHLPKEQYEQLQDMARFCGMTIMADQMYPSALANQYTNRMLSGSNTLSSLQGVDLRLLTIAHEREMEVLEVESLEAQLDMYGQYSDLLQKYMVLDGINTDRNSYVAHNIELYQLWCSGDEAALIEYLQDDEIPEEATEEEIQAYEEYNNHMLASRDVDMLAKAEEYLATGKTVFFAVGLAHLLGETGLVEALREAGYTVTLVEYAAP